MFYFDENGFISTQGAAAGQTELQPPLILTLPRFVDGVWQEGIARRAALFDELGFYLSTHAEIDPRETNNFTTVPIPQHLILPRFVNNQWVEGILTYVAVLDDENFLSGFQTNVDPRTISDKHVLSFPPTDYLVPKFIDGEWRDMSIAVAAILDVEGYLVGHAERIDPRTINSPFTTILPESQFLVPRFVNNEWVEAGIQHAWQIDDEGFFVADLHNFDPRTTVLSYTTVPLESGAFRKPQFINGAWVEGNPILPAELIANAKASKRALIESSITAQLTAGVPFKFGDHDDIIQTRFERDLINISGVTTRAILLKSQGEENAVIQFRAESNTTYLLTPDEAIALGQTVAEYSEQIYNKGWSLKDQLEQADDLEDIEAIAW